MTILYFVTFQFVIILAFCYIWRLKDAECEHLRTRTEIWKELAYDKMNYQQKIFNRIEEKQNQILDIIKIFNH